MAFRAGATVTNWSADPAMAALKAYIEFRQAGDWTGLTGAAIAQALNNGATITNPVPQGSATKATVGKSDVLKVLYAVKNHVSALVHIGDPTANPPVAPDSTKAGLLTLLQGIVDDVIAWPLDTLTSDAVSGYGGQLVGLGLVQSNVVTALVSMPDPAYQTTISVSAPALAFGLGDVTAADVAAILAE